MWEALFKLLANYDPTWVGITFVTVFFLIYILVIRILAFLKRIALTRGIPNPMRSGSYLIPPEKKRDVVFDKLYVWEKEIKVDDGKVIGKIGFYKDITVFRIFGSYWNSATSEGAEGFERFIEEWSPPEFIGVDQRKEIACFLFVNECNLQSYLVSIIKKHSLRWRHVYVVCSKRQYMKGELDLIDNVLGLNLNIEIIPIPEVN